MKSNDYRVRFFTHAVKAINEYLQKQSTEDLLKNGISEEEILNYCKSCFVMYGDYIGQGVLINWNKKGLIRWEKDKIFLTEKFKNEYKNIIEE